MTTQPKPAGIVDDKEAVSTFKLRFLEESKHEDFKETWAALSDPNVTLTDASKKIISAQHYLQEAHVEIESREKLYKDTTKNTLFLGLDVLLEFINTKELIDPAAWKNELQTQLQSAFFTAAGLPYDLQTAINGITDIRVTLKSWKENPEKMIEFLALNATNFNDIKEAAVLAVKRQLNPEIPSEVAKNVKNYIEEFQTKCDEKQDAFFETTLKYLQDISAPGILPTDKNELAKITQHLMVLNEQLANIQKRAENNPDDVALRHKADSMQLRCKDLPIWRESGAADILGLRDDPVMNAAVNVDTILHSHPPKTDAIEEAKFLIAIDEQRKRGVRGINAAVAGVVSDFNPKVGELALSLRKAACISALGVQPIFGGLLGKEGDLKQHTLTAIQFLYRLKSDDELQNKKIDEQVGAIKLHYLEKTKREFDTNDIERICQEDKQSHLLRSVKDPDWKALVDGINHHIKENDLVNDTVSYFVTHLIDYVYKEKTVDLTYQKATYLFGSTENIPENITKMHDELKKLNMPEKWNWVARVVSDEAAQQEGIPTDRKKLLEKQAEFTTRLADIQNRHHVLTTFLAENKHFSLTSPLNARAAYLADLTPYTLKELIKKLNTLEEIAKQGVMLPDHQTQILNDIKKTQQEIAITLYERLLLANNGVPADLVAQLSNASPSKAYSLSDQDVRNYMSFIEKHGDDALKQDVKDKLKNTAEILLRRTMEFDNHFDDYVTAKENNNDAAAQVAYKKLAEKNHWLLPSQFINGNDPLSPINIVQGKWANSVSNQKTVLVQQNKYIHETLEPALKSAGVREAKLTTDLKRYRESSAPLKFARWVFSGFTGESKRTAQLTAARNNLIGAKAKLKNEKDSHELITYQLNKHVRKMVGYVVEHIKKEIMENPQENTGKIDAVRQFVAAQVPGMTDELNRALDFSKELVIGIESGEVLETLKNYAQCVVLTEKNKADAVERVMSLLNGESLYNNAGESAIEKLNDDIQTIIPDRSKTDDESGFVMVSSENPYGKKVYEAIKEKYLQDIVQRSNDGKQLERLFDFYDAGEVSELMSVRFAEPQDFSNLALVFAFKKADRYTDVRDHCFKQFLQPHLDTFLNTHGEYSEEDYERARSVFESAEKARLDNESMSITKKIFNETLTARFAKEDKPTWNQQFSRLVEEYGTPENIGEYRLIKMHELVQKSAGIHSKETEENSFKTFLSAVPGGITTLKRNLTADQNTLIAKLVTEMQPSWMHEIMVRELGTPEQLKAMHTKWIMNMLNAMDQEKDTGLVEPMLRELFESIRLSHANRLVLTEDDLNNFVGKENVQAIKKALQQVIANKINKEIEPIQASGAINDIVVAPPEIDERIRTLGGVVGESLMQAFNVDPRKNLSEKWKARRDANVLAKAYFQDVSYASKREDVLQDQQNILLSATAVKPTTVVENTEFDFVEENDLTRDLLATHKKYEYDYRKTPDIFYKNYLLTVQDICIKELKSKIPEMFVTPDMTSNDLMKAFSQFKTDWVEPIATLDKRHVEPIVAFLTHAEPAAVFHDTAFQNSAALETALIRLGTDNHLEDLSACKTWCEHNTSSPAVNAVTYYIQACEKAADIRQLLNSGYAYLDVESVIDEIVKTKKATDTDIKSFIVEHKNALEKLPVLRSRLAEPLNDLIENYKNDLEAKGLIDPKKAEQIKIIVQQFGSKALKERFERYEVIANLLSQPASNMLKTYQSISPSKMDEPLLVQGLLRQVDRLSVSRDLIPVFCAVVTAINDEPLKQAFAAKMTDIMSTILEKCEQGDRWYRHTLQDLVSNPYVSKFMNTRTDEKVAAVWKSAQAAAKQLTQQPSHEQLQMLVNRSPIFSAGRNPVDGIVLKGNTEPVTGIVKQPKQ